MLKLNDQNFEEEILKTGKLVLVDFFAEWCGPCKMMSPVLEKVAVEYKDRLTIIKIDLDESPITAEKYRINAVPNLMLFKDGKPISSFVGLKPETILKEWLNKFLE